MTQSAGLQSSESRPLQMPRRASLRRTPRPAAERRIPFTRSDVRRGTGAVSEEEVNRPEAGRNSALFQEKLATLQVQATIVAAMLGMLVFFRAPLATALSSLFG